jgi:hypothetical protein
LVKKNGWNLFQIFLIQFAFGLIDYQLNQMETNKADIQSETRPNIFFIISKQAQIHFQIDKKTDGFFQKLGQKAVSKSIVRIFF